MGRLLAKSTGEFREERRNVLTPACDFVEAVLKLPAVHRREMLERVAQTWSDGKFAKAING